MDHLVSTFVKDFFVKIHNLFLKSKKLTHIFGVDTLTGHRKPISQFDSLNVIHNIHSGYLTIVSRHSFSFCAFPMLVAAFPLLIQLW
jgi:hypothetical protein